MWADHGEGNKTYSNALLDQVIFVPFQLRFQPDDLRSVGLFGCLHPLAIVGSLRFRGGGETEALDGIPVALDVAATFGFGDSGLERIDAEGYR